MKRHYVLKNKKRFYIFIIIMTIIFSSMFLASSVYGYEEKEYDIVTVKTGDTLWTIADNYNRSGDIRKLIYRIKKVNNLDSSLIYSGDILMIPK